VPGGQSTVAIDYSNVKPSKEDILEMIDTYKAPPLPEGSLHETYDFRLQYKEPVPATLTDVFICDIWQRITMDLKIAGSRPNEVSEETILMAFNVYMTRYWETIAGYRPWTHWNFIRSLNESERVKLAKQTVNYMHSKGVRDVF
jgi:hypothetical protein